MRRTANYVVLTIFFTLYLASWLPYFDIVNAPTFVGPFPQPMALGLALNVFTTALVIVVYFVFFKPYARRMAVRVEEREDETSTNQARAEEARS